MPDFLITSVINEPAVKQQFDTLLHYLDEVIKKIQAVNALSINPGGTTAGAGAGAGGGAPAVDALTRAQKRLAEAQSALGAQIAYVNEQTRQQNLVNRTAAQGQQAAATSLNALRAELSAATRQFDAFTAAERAAATQGGATLATIQRLQVEIRALENETGRAQRNVGNYPQALAGGLSGFLGAFGAGGAGSVLAAGSLAAAATAGIAALGGLTKSVFDSTVKLDSYNSSLKAVSKTQEELAINQRFLGEVTDKFGLNLQAITTAYKNFYAASTQAGLGATQTRTIFSQVSEVSANLKLSQEDTNGVLLAFSQILSKGKVAAEELRGQIGERIPGATAIMARALGVTNAELEKMLATGKILAQDALPKFAAELEKAFGNGGKPIESLQGSVNRLSNDFTKLINDNESGLSRFFAGIVDGADGALKALDKLFTSARDLGGRISNPSQLTDQELTPEYIAKQIALIEKLNKSGKALFDDNAKTLFLEAIKRAKADNDQYIDEFSKDNKSMQDQLIISARRNVAEATAEYTRLTATSQGLSSGVGSAGSAAADFGKTSVAAIQASINVSKYADQLKRALDVQKTGAPQAPIGLTQAQLDALNKKRIDANAKIEEDAITQHLITDQRIIDDDELSYKTRTDAAKRFFENSNKLEKLRADANKAIVEQEISEHKNVTQSKEAIDADYLVSDRKNKEKLLDNLKKFNQDDYKNKVEAAKLALALSLDTIQGQQNTEQINASDKYRAQRDAIAEQPFKSEKLRRQADTANDEVYERQKLEITTKYAKLRLGAELTFAEGMLAIDQTLSNPQKVAQDEQAILDIKRKIDTLDTEQHIKNNDKKQKSDAETSRNAEELAKATSKAYKDLEQQSLTFVKSIGDGIYDRQKDALQSALNDLDTKKQAEEEAIDASLLSETEKTKQKAIIDRNYDAQQTALKNKQKKIDEDKAKFDKAASIAGIIEKTAEAVVAVLKIPGAGFGLAAAVAAIGALELATVLATPIPKYRDGKMTAGKAEWAITGDGGINEVLAGPNGEAYETPNTPTLTYIPDKYKVYPSVDKYLDSIGHKTMWKMPENKAESPNLVGAIDRQTKTIVNGLRDGKTVININYTHAGVQTSLKKASSYSAYINKNVRGIV